MKRILSMILAVMFVVSMFTFAGVQASAAEPDELVLQDIEYEEVIGRVNQNDSGWTQSSTSIWAGPNTGSRNDSGWQFYYIDIGAYSENARNPNGSDRDLDESFLDSLRVTLTNLRNNGGNCMIRVTYSINGYEKCEPSTFDQLLTHQTQLAGVFKDYPDVIAFVECGMIGAFGEMWGGRYSNTKSKVTVLDGWLTQLPEEITVNVRTAMEYYNYVASSELYRTKYRAKTINGVKYPASINEENFSQFPFYNTIFSRIGCYNDAMIQDGNDGGSFSSGRDNFNRWLGWKSKVTNYGGEFSGEMSFRTNVSTTFWLPGRSFPEFYQSHLSYYHGGNAAYSGGGSFYQGGYRGTYKNTSTFGTIEEAEAYQEKFYDLFGRFAYDMDWECSLSENADGKYVLTKVSGGWSSGTMTDDLLTAIEAVATGDAELRDYFGQPMSIWFEDHLGYRIVLRESYVSKSVAKGGVLKVNGVVDNVGFANITREKAAEIVITDGENTYVVPTDVDARDWASTERHSYDLEIKLPSGIPAGDYEVFFRIAGKTPDGATNAANGVRFCNPGEYTYFTQGTTHGISSATVNIIYNSDLGGNYLGKFTVTDEETAGSDDTAKQVYTSFNDMKGHWSKEDVTAICSLGYMSGVGGGKFAPETIATRAQFVTVLYNIEGNPSVKSVAAPFTDIKGWYNAAIKWAYSEGIVNGTSPTTFSPNTKLDRQTFATMLYRYAEYKGVDVKSVKGDLSKFTDKNKVSDWALEAMKWANAEGYITGMTSTTIVPKGKATRAQMATIMSRYMIG